MTKRAYIKRLHIDMGGYQSNYEELPNVEDFRTIIETRTMPEQYLMQLLKVRA